MCRMGVSAAAAAKKTPGPSSTDANAESVSTHSIHNTPLIEADVNKSIHAIPTNASDNQCDNSSSLLSLRVNYLLVILAVMLADGLQGTHLYVLYESYGVSVASLFSLGFVAGALATPMTGPLIDKFGRRRCALLYCALEMAINALEQYPWYWGLVLSRMVGGITTNLLHSNFEAWLDTEAQRTKIPQHEYGLLLRDAMVVSNLAAIASGCLAHVLAERLGAVGPFQGAVGCTGLAFFVILLLWTENYGSTNAVNNDDSNKTESVVRLDDGESSDDVSWIDDSSDTGEDTAGTREPVHSTAVLLNPPLSSSSDDRSILLYLRDAIQIFRSDSRILRVGIIQGLTGGSLQIFIFLWSPTLQGFAKAARTGNLHTLSSYWMDSALEPAYGLIFGAFMAAGVLGGLCSPILRKLGSKLVAPRIIQQQQQQQWTNQAPRTIQSTQPTTTTQDNSCSAKSAKSLHVGSFPSAVAAVSEPSTDQPLAVEFLASICYFVSVIMLLVPCLVDPNGIASFGLALLAFLIHEFSVGVVMPCEGVIRSLYMPADDRATMMSFPRMIVNLAVSLGVLLTNHFSAKSSFAAVAFLMTIACALQLSLISLQEWSSLWCRVDRHVIQPSRQSSRIVMRAMDSFCSVQSRCDRPTTRTAASSSPCQTASLLGDAPKTITGSYPLGGNPRRLRHGATKFWNNPFFSESFDTTLLETKTNRRKKAD